MSEQAGFVSVIHETVASSKETSQMLHDKIDNAFAGEVKLSTSETRAIATLLTVNATLVAGLLEENSRILDQLYKTLDRLSKKD